MQQTQKLLRLEKIAERYDFSLATLRRWASERRFPIQKISNKIWVDVEQFELWINQHTIQPYNGGNK
ncbi:MAG: helix-turn-helix transcriptional regulator [Ignavibacteriales bacterium]